MTKQTKPIDILPDVVGQDSVKSKLLFFLNGYQNTGFVPPLLFSAAKGGGKTYIAKEFRKLLMQREGDDKGQRKVLHYLNAATISNASQFVDWVIKHKLNDKEVTIMLDEAHKIPANLIEPLLTILQPTAECRNTLEFKDYILEFDLKKVTFLFATSKVHQLDTALIDRLERVDLEEYTDDQLAEIIRRNLKGVEFDDGVLEKEVVSVLRGNARSAQKMAAHIQSYLGKMTTFFSEDWQKIRKALGIMPLGLSPLEIKVLEILKAHKETSLTRISACTGMTPEAIRQDAEMSLQRLDLMQITTLGRSLTANGHLYLKNLSAEG